MPALPLLRVPPGAPARTPLLEAAPSRVSGPAWALAASLALAGCSSLTSLRTGPQAPPPAPATPAAVAPAPKGDRAAAPPPSSASSASPAARPEPSAASPAARPRPSAASEAKAYRQDAAQHLYTANRARIFPGKLPPLLYAIGVLDVEVDGQGEVRGLSWQRAPRHAPEVIAEIERTVRAAAPYPAPSRMGRVVYTDVWLWDKSGRFQLDTLSEGQR